MKTRILLPLLCWALAACSGSTSEPAKPAKAAKDVKLHLALLPQGEVVPGTPVEVLAKLTDARERALITDDDLTVMHNAPFHLLLLDPAYADFQHIHPKPTATRGVYSFSFTPKTASYRAWADVTLKATGSQSFTPGDIGNPRRGAISTSDTREVGMDGYHFAFAFDKPVMNKATTGTLRVSDRKGSAVTSFDPVMGEVAHIVGFYDDYRTVLHTHAEVAREEMQFTLTPKKAGFLKLFAHLRINGKDYYVPFGVVVAAK